MMLSRLINRLNKKQRIISLILFVLVISMFIAVWFLIVRKPTYKVSFFPENGSKSFSVKVNAGTSLPAPNQPYLDGYEFQYWSEDGINEFDLSQIIESDHKLYAVYLKICNVVFLNDNAVYSTETVLQGNRVRTPKEPEKAGFSFDYWELDGSKYDFSSAVDKDLTLLAKYITRVPCTSIVITDEPFYVGTDDSLIPTVIIKPDNCTDKPVFKTDDPQVAAVNEDGSIIGISPGQTRLYVICGDMRAETSLICSEQVDYIELSDNVYNIAVGESVDIKATVEPSEASVYKLTYRVDDADVAFINDKGVITGRNGGTTRVTVSSANGRSTSATVNVNGAYLEVSGLPSSLYTTYSSSEEYKYPVKLLYTEWKDGTKTTDNACEGALLQCSIDAIRYENGFIYQCKPVDYTISSDIYFTFLTSKSNSSFVICEPSVAIKSAINLDNTGQTSYSVTSPGLSAELTMNCAGTWAVIDSSADIQFRSDSVSCSFIPGDSDIQLRFISNGGQSIDIKISK